MAGEIKISGLEESLLEWGIDQSLGSQIGEKVNSIILPVANSLNGGASLQVALLAAAIQFASTEAPTITNPTLETVLTAVLPIAVAVEGGETIEQALTGVLATFLPVAAPAAVATAATAASPSFQPQSWLSAHLGLDSHPALLSSINQVLGTAAAAAGADVNSAVSTAVSAGSVSSTEVVNAAVGALKAAGATVSAADVQSIVGQIIDHAPILNPTETAIVKAIANGLIGLIFH
jgi:hypothetical protein